MDSSIEKPEDKLSTIIPIQSGNIPIEDKTNELAKEKPNKYLQKGEKESNRQYKKKVEDYKDVVSQAKKYGIDLEHKEGMPLTDADKEKIKYNIQKLAPVEMMGKINDRINALSVPQQETRPDIDVKRLLEEQKKIRRAKFADSLMAFGAGLQGKNIDPENFYSNKLARQRDVEFQKYKDVTDRNKRARDLWNIQTTNELINWLEEQKKDERATEAQKQKYQQLIDFHKDEMKAKERGFAIQEQRNKIEAAKATNEFKKSQAKENKPVIIKTSDGISHSLKPEEAQFYKSKALENLDLIKDEYPGYFQEIKSANPLTGEEIITYRPLPQIKDADWIRAYMEIEQPKNTTDQKTIQPTQTQKITTTSKWDQYELK